MTYLEDYASASDNDFIKRTAIAVLKAAQAIRNEDPETPYHLPRVRLAVNAANGADGVAKSFTRLLVIAADPKVTQASTDAEIDTGVSQVWNTVAGIL